MGPTPSSAERSTPRQRVFVHGEVSVGAARMFVEHTLAEWRISDRVDDIRLCVSELATNALVHGTPKATGFLVQLSKDGQLVRVEVHDTSSALPAPQAPDVDSDSGRGLLLVAACADGWGVEPYADHKVVWAEFKNDVTSTVG
jgi:anti-sigma regulatory factor (Ser/Thr protein kinase)